MADHRFDPVALMKRILGNSTSDGRVRRETSAYEAFMGFTHAINWKERNMLFLYCFLVGYAILLVVTRKNINVRLALFIATCGLVYSAQYMNAFFAHNERWVALGWTQDYFDKNGVFMSSVFCAPLLFIAFVQLVRYGAMRRCNAIPTQNAKLTKSPTSPPPRQLHSLRESVLLMVKIKRADLRRKAIEDKAAAAGGGGEVGPEASASKTSTSTKRAATPVKKQPTTKSSKKNE